MQVLLMHYTASLVTRLWLMLHSNIHATVDAAGSIVAIDAGTKLAHWTCTSSACRLSLTCMPAGEVYLRKPWRAAAPSPALFLLPFLPLALPLSSRLASDGARMYLPATSSHCSQHTESVCWPKTGQLIKRSKKDNTSMQVDIGCGTCGM